MSKDAKDNPAAGTRFNWDLALKLVAAIVSVATLGFGIYQYVGKQGRDKDDLLYKNKQELYTKAMDSASAFANASTQGDADTARKQFWELYYGKLSAVEDVKVKKAMQTFGGALKKWEEFNDPSDFTSPAEFEYVPDGETERVTFKDLSYRLTQACRADLGNK